MKRLIFLIFLCMFFISACTKKDGRVEITYSTWGSQTEIQTIKQIIKDFEHEYPEIKIKLLHIPDNYFQKLHLLVASDLSPDVIFVNNLNARIYITANKFEPITLKSEDFTGNSLLPFSFKGKIYAVPRDVSNLVVYYNKDLFDKYKVSYPTQNWTLTEFLEKAQELTIDIDKDGKTDIFGFGFEKNSLYWLPFLFSNNGGIISQDEKEIILNKPQSIEALQFYADLRNKYHIAPKADEQASLTTSQMFLQEKTAMHLCGRWCSQTYKKNANFNWDIAKFPTGKNGSVVGLDGSGWAISSTSKHKIEAKKFIDFMSSYKSVKFMTEGGLIFPALKEVAYSSAFRTPPPQNTNVFFDTLKSSESTPISSKYAEINDILNTELEPLFEGEKNAKEVVTDNLIKKLNSKLD